MTDDTLILRTRDLERRLLDLERREYVPVQSTWVPVFAGFSADPAGPICRYTLIGSLCIASVMMPATGTSNANTFTVTAPFAAKTVTNMTWYAACRFYNNGVRGTVWGMANIGTAGTVFNIYKDPNGSAWTASGGKSANFTIAYEVA